MEPGAEKSEGSVKSEEEEESYLFDEEEWMIKGSTQSA